MNISSACKLPGLISSEGWLTNMLPAPLHPFKLPKGRTESSSFGPYASSAPLLPENQRVHAFMVT